MEYRGILEDLLLRNDVGIKKNVIATVVRVSPNHVIFKSNNAWRFLKYEDQKGAGGNDIYERVGSTDLFSDEYDGDKATLSSGVYDFDGDNGTIRFLKTGKLAQGYYDLKQMKTTASSTARADTHTKSTLPLNAENGQLALVSDGNLDGSSVMAYFDNGTWKRITNGSDKSNCGHLLVSRSIKCTWSCRVSLLSEGEKTQNGLFYSSWHQSTSNASSEQHYSNWDSSLVAGSTRGDDNKSTLGGSTKFGPEIGFVEQANSIDLAGGRSIGILKHAIGASQLTDGTHIVSHNGNNYICIQSHQSTDAGGSNYVSTMPEPGTTIGDTYWSTTNEVESAWSSSAGSYNDKGLSDWDLTDTGDKRGDALRDSS